MIKWYKLLIFFSVSLLLIKCANQLPPPGGPIDRVPPEVLEVYPSNGTTNFDDDHLEITFSEYIDKMSIMNALFISPEIKNLGYDWSGTSVEITFDDTLQENTTYTVSIGSNIQDLNNKNNLAQAVNFAFSTGPKLDVGKISGRVYDKDPNGVMIFAYMKTDTFANPLVVKPKNVSQVGDNGEFFFLGLANGVYRVFAVKEENNNRIYNVGEDMYGAPYTEITLTDSESTFDGLNYKLTKEDTTAPYISNITMTDRNHILIEYSEDIDSSKITNDNFSIVDSTTQKVTPTVHFFKPTQNKPEYYVTVADSLNKEGNHFVIAKNVFDRKGNEMVFDSYQFAISTAPDTLAPSFKKSETGFEKNKIDYKDPSFVIYFNDGITTESFKDAVSIKYKKKNYSFDVFKIDDAAYRIKILNKLKPNKKLDLDIDSKLIWDTAGNQLDTVNTIHLETLSGREFSGVSGQIQLPEFNNNIIVVLNGTERENKTYYTPMHDDKSFNFERVLPGNYLIWCFIDSDKDGKYNYGSVKPFEYSERFFAYPDTLELKARWPVGDVMITEDFQ